MVSLLLACAWKTAGVLGKGRIIVAARVEEEKEIIGGRGQA